MAFVLRLRRRHASANCVMEEKKCLQARISTHQMCIVPSSISAPQLRLLLYPSVCLFSLLAAAVKVGWPSPLSQQPQQLHGIRAEVHGLGIGLSDPRENERARPSFLPCLVCFLSPFLSVLNCLELLQLGQGIKHLVRLKVHGQMNDP